MKSTGKQRFKPLKFETIWRVRQSNNLEIKEVGELRLKFIFANQAFFSADIYLPEQQQQTDK